MGQLLSKNRIEGLQQDDGELRAEAEAKVKPKGKAQSALHALMRHLRQTWPARRTDNRHPAGPNHAEMAGAVSAVSAVSAVGTVQPARSGTILLVSTEGGCMQVLAPVLAQEGYRVYQANSLNDALAGLRQECPDLIIFCGRAGPEDWLALRRVTSIPILALMSRPTETEVSDALDSGVDDCQAMSIGTWEALSRVHALLRRGLI